MPGAVEIFLLLFADDMILLSDTVVGLQNQLNSLKQEADRLQLTINLEKTNIVVFRKGGHLSQNEIWWYGNTEVKVTNTYKYLGMIFTTKLSLNTGWLEMCRKGKKGVIEILRSMRKLGSTDFFIFGKLFDAQIQPMITYAAEIWGLSENIYMERVHTYPIKRFLNIQIHSSNTLVYGETGRYALFIGTYVKCIKYWIKLTRLSPFRLCRQAYEKLFIQSEAGKENWASQVKQVLTRNGFGLVWLCLDVGNESEFLAEFKDRMLACFKQNWHSKIEENEKYTWLYSFKNIF